MRWKNAEKNFDSAVLQIENGNRSHQKVTMQAMNSERSRLYYTCVFLQVSFRAIENSVTAEADETRRCWLDAQTLQMLLGELTRCRQSAAPFHEIHSPLDQAVYHCGLLMAQCPGALDQRLCKHHLDAINAPLAQAIGLLSGTATKRSEPAARPGRRLGAWLKR